MPVIKALDELVGIAKDFSAEISLKRGKPYEGICRLNVYYSIILPRFFINKRYKLRLPIQDITLPHHIGRKDEATLLEDPDYNP